MMQNCLSKKQSQPFVTPLPLQRGVVKLVKVAQVEQM